MATISSETAHVWQHNQDAHDFNAGTQQVDYKKIGKFLGIYHNICTKIISKIYNEIFSILVIRLTFSGNNLSAKLSETMKHFTF